MNTDFFNRLESYIDAKIEFAMAPSVETTAALERAKRELYAHVVWQEQLHGA